MNIRVSDIKQYFYCPRVVYHTYYTPVTRPTTHPMQLGAIEHEVLSVLERRRTLSRYGLDTGSRQFHIFTVRGVSRTERCVRSAH